MQLWFNIRPNDTPRICLSRSCNKPFSIHHADSCAKGGSIIKRHDYIKLIFTRYSERAFGQGSTSIEPPLGRVENETNNTIKGNMDDGARADILIQDYGSIHSNTYIDVGVVSPVCPSNKCEIILNTVGKAERKKNFDYKERANKILGAKFLPIVLTSGGCVSKSTKYLISKLARKIETNNHSDSKLISNDIRTELSMSLINSRAMSMRAVKFCVASQVQLTPLSLSVV